MPLNNRKVLFGLLGLIAACSIIFVVWPSVDLQITGWFFKGAGFPIAHNGPIEAFRLLLWDASLVVLALFLVMTWNEFQKQVAEATVENAGLDLASQIVMISAGFVLLALSWWLWESASHRGSNLSTLLRLAAARVPGHL